ncbi:site-specific DNA-methyltransferase [Patescibacteria group bacterium]|nr:site-specific DNA-methyltransferase [Patescibacteria group bacterium]
MTKNDNKLELNWANKDKSLYYDPNKKEYLWVDKKDPRVSEPRIFLHKATYGDKNSENMLIKGDNLLALKALLQDFRNRVKLIYIDPPYNTGNAFEHYDDGLEHSIWLGMMKTRLENLRDLLSKNGIIWISIDDEEGHYLKVLCDEVFGRKNFITTVAVRMSTASGVKTSHREKTLVKEKEYLLVYAKNKELVSFKPQYLPVFEWDNEFQYYLDKNKSNNPKDWTIKHLKTVLKENKIEFSPTSKSFQNFITTNADKIWRRAFIRGSNKELSLRQPKKILVVKDRQDKIHYLYGGRELYFLERKFHNCFTEEGYKKLPSNLIGDFWTDINTGKLFNEGGVDFRSGKKPEFLVARIVDMMTNEGEIILDSFAGSGSTGAVAHKMNRKWIMIEMGKHANTHIIPRLKKIISGKDNGGITKAVNWKGGGGFKYFELGDSLFVADDDLRLTVLNPKVYNGALIRAVLKVEGFRLLNPDNALHGISGRTIAHVTEQYLSPEYVQAILREVGDKADYLVVYAKTISSKIKPSENVEIRKIPDVLLKKFKV